MKYSWIFFIEKYRNIECSITYEGIHSMRNWISF